MDTSTGKLYPSFEKAVLDGANPDEVVELRKITKGPFKGRVYELTKKGGLGRRRLDLERDEKKRRQLSRFLEA